MFVFTVDMTKAYFSLFLQIAFKCNPSFFFLIQYVLNIKNSKIVLKIKTRKRSHVDI